MGISQVETVARGMFEADQEDTLFQRQMNRIVYGTEDVTWEFVNDANFVRPEATEKYWRHARAAIKAMRVPTEPMLDAGGREGSWTGFGPSDKDTAIGVWEAMCDAALVETDAADKVAQDLQMHGVAFTKDGKHIPASEVYLPPADDELKNPPYSNRKT